MRTTSTIKVCAIVLIVTGFARVGTAAPRQDEESRTPYSFHYFAEFQDEEEAPSANDQPADPLADPPEPTPPPPPTLPPPPPSSVPRLSPFTAQPADGPALSSLASVPFMIGDTASGSCASVTFLGAIDGQVNHPTLACSRLNIAENNSARLQDRAYVSYRHFHNTTRTKVFQFENDLDIDRFTFGLEKTFCCGQFSLEARVPVARELGSTFDITIDDFDPSRTTVPLSDRDGEFGNVSVIGKILLLERETFLLSGGVACLLPTAENVNANGDFFAFFEIIEPNLLFAFADVDFNVLVRNETVNLSPFLAWAWAPNERFFHQGFLQIDVPLNPSASRITANGAVFPFNQNTVFPTILLDVDEQRELLQQTLLRLNLGAGYWFYENPCASRVQRMAALLELHYTTTLNNAKLAQANLFSFDFGGAMLPVDVAIGNGANRVDVLNLTLGHVAQLGNVLVTNGFVVPLRSGDDKPFDFEYNLQVQCLF